MLKITYINEYILMKKMFNKKNIRKSYQTNRGESKQKYQTFILNGNRPPPPFSPVEKLGKIKG